MSVYIPVKYVIRHSVSRAICSDKCMHTGYHPYTYDVCNKASSLMSSGNVYTHA